MPAPDPSEHGQVDPKAGCDSHDAPADLRDENDQSDPDQRATERHPESGLRVLVVDDDAQVLSVLTAMIESLGHSVTSCDIGADALGVVESGEPLDLLVTDFAMPHMTGGELARQALTTRPELAIIVATGQIAVPELPSACLLLHKPMTRVELQSAIFETVTEAGSQPV